MKPFKSNWKEHGQSDEMGDRAGKRSKKSRRPLHEEDESEFQSWMNRTSDVSDYLDDAEDFYTPPGKA